MAEETMLLDAAVREVFERMLWQRCQAAHVDCGSDERIAAWIEMQGTPAGRCAVEVPACAGDQLADALLGSEGDWDDELIEDAVGELCNMITGGVKTLLGAEPGECTITLPQIVRIVCGRVVWRTGSVARRPAEYRAQAGVRRLYWFSEASTLAVTLELEADEPAADRVETFSACLNSALPG